jgi:hypothetical protein
MLGAAGNQRIPNLGVPKTRKRLLHRSLGSLFIGLFVIATSRSIDGLQQLKLVHNNFGLFATTRVASVRVHYTVGCISNVSATEFAGRYPALLSGFSKRDVEFPVSGRPSDQSHHTPEASVCEAASSAT